MAKKATTKKKTGVQLGDYLTSINKSKKNLMRDPEINDPGVVSGYPAFLVRRLLSYHPDAILLANEMNRRPFLDNQLQYEFFLHVLPKANRFAPLHKNSTPENLELVKAYYRYSNEKALSVLPLHTQADFDHMKEFLSEGGVIKD